MKNLSSLINSLDGARKTTTVANKFEISELTLTQQRKMIASIFDNIEAPAKLALAFNEIIRDCVNVVGDNTDELTVADRPFLLRALRDLIVGNTAVKITKDDNGEEIRTEYELFTNDYSKFDSLPKSTIIDIDKSTKIYIKVPTLTRDNIVNRQLLDKLTSYRRTITDKKQLDGGQIAVFYFTFELIKYIDKIETGENVFKFEDLLVSEQLKVVDHLKTPIVTPIVDFIKDIKEGEKVAFMAINKTTGETENLSMEHTIFSREI